MVPENGLISLNVPLDPLRLGSHSTRTTHPFYMARWNDLLGKLGIDSRLTNPYRYRTKGEMVKECRNRKLLETMLHLTISCSSPRKATYIKNTPMQHCGFCVPCIIRKASIRAAGLNDTTTYTLPDLSIKILNPKRAEGLQARAFQIASKRIIDDPNLAHILIHKPGPLRDDQDRINDLADVYRRGMIEVANLLQGVTVSSS